MDAFIGGYKEAVKYFDREEGEKRIEVYINGELKGTFYSAIVLGVPVNNEVSDEDDFEMRIFTVGPFNIGLFLTAQRLFNDVISREIEQFIKGISNHLTDISNHLTDISNHLAEKYGKNSELIQRITTDLVKGLKKQIVKAAKTRIN